VNLRILAASLVVAAAGCASTTPISPPWNQEDGFVATKRPGPGEVTITTAVFEIRACGLIDPCVECLGARWVARHLLERVPGASSCTLSRIRFRLERAFKSTSSRMASGTEVAEASFEISGRDKPFVVEVPGKRRG
jgi:hypothetical protein